MTETIEDAESIEGQRFVTYIVAEPYVDILDKACIEECPVDCMYQGVRMLCIHPDECVDCVAAKTQPTGKDELFVAAVRGRS
ncbi:Ferredoxin [Rhodococcus sp. AW25M09]|nr:Ferredoxin [Rhodococcus sp. AW25M09]